MLSESKVEIRATLLGRAADDLRECRDLCFRFLLQTFLRKPFESLQFHGTAFFDHDLFLRGLIDALNATGFFLGFKTTVLSVLSV